MLSLIRQHPVITIVLLVILALLAWGFRPQPVLVETVTARRAPMTITIEEEGRTRVIDRYVIAAPVNGVTCRQDLDVGDAVAQGEILLEISPLESQLLDPRSRAEARARIAGAEAALQAAREDARSAAAAARLAEKEVERLRPLRERGVISEEEFDRAETNLETAVAARRSAEFNVQTARYELEAARTALDVSAATDGGEAAEEVPVPSPISGRILGLVHECEGPVRTGEPLLEVGDTSRLEVAVDVLSTDAVQISPGGEVLLERWGGGDPLRGKVRRVEPVGFTKISALGVEEQRVWVIVDFSSPQEEWQRLGDGYRVEARFVLWQEDNVLQVPASSVFRYEDGWALFAVEDHRAQLRPVTVGKRNGLTAQILEGLTAGEQVIDHPSDQVDDGVRVRGI